jgi:AraC-like DNA-binding protein
LDFSDLNYPLQREADYSSISPSVHWAKLHRTIRNLEYPLRRIYDFELLYVMEGRMTAELNGLDYPLSSGDLLFIPAGVPHKLNIESKHGLFLGIHFDFFDEFFIEEDEEIIVDEAAPRADLFCKEAVIPGKRLLSAKPVRRPDAALVQDMKRMIEEHERRRPDTDTMCKAIMLQILLKLYRMDEAETEEKSFQMRQRMDILADWIDEHYAEPCSNQELSRMISFHEDYMIKQFKVAYGMTPNKYLQTVRHRHAKALLLESDQSIEAIGEAVGYGDIYYFSRIFRKWEGISPRDYRNRKPMY